MSDARFPATWAPYMTWAKHSAKAPVDLTGSNLLPCTLGDLPGALEAVELYGRNDDGWPPLVDRIASRFNVDRARVATAPGGSGANFMALASVVRPGDTVLVEWPGYDPHSGAARMLGARVTTFDRGWDARFAVDPDRIRRALTPDTRAIVITNLHNPTGVWTSSAEMEAVGELASSVGAKVIVDEVYLDAATGVEGAPAATLGDVFVSTNSLTKSYGLAGIRIGWILADAATAERARRIRDVVDGVGSIPSETLGVVAFEHLDRLLERARSLLDENQARIRGFVEARSELDWIPPAGGGVAFPRLAGVDDTRPFIELAARELGVGVTPGHLFGAPEHFRVAVAGETATLVEGLSRLGQALDRWAESRG